MDCVRDLRARSHWVRRSLVLGVGGAGERHGERVIGRAKEILGILSGCGQFLRAASSS